MRPTTTADGCPLTNHRSNVSAPQSSYLRTWTEANTLPFLSGTEQRAPNNVRRLRDSSLYAAASYVHHRFLRYAVVKIVETTVAVPKFCIGIGTCLTFREIRESRPSEKPPGNAACGSQNALRGQIPLSMTTTGQICTCRIPSHLHENSSRIEPLFNHII